MQGSGLTSRPSNHIAIVSMREVAPCRIARMELMCRHHIRAMLRSIAGVPRRGSFIQCHFEVLCQEQIQRPHLNMRRKLPCHAKVTSPQNLQKCGKLPRTWCLDLLVVLQAACLCKRSVAAWPSGGDAQVWVALVAAFGEAGSRASGSRSKTKL